MVMQWRDHSGLYLQAFIRGMNGHCTLISTKHPPKLNARFARPSPTRQSTHLEAATTPISATSESAHSHPAPTRSETVSLAQCRKASSSAQFCAHVAANHTGFLLSVPCDPSFEVPSFVDDLVMVQSVGVAFVFFREAVFGQLYGSAHVACQGGTFVDELVMLLTCECPHEVMISSAMDGVQSCSESMKDS
jgi:hypothetical protein